MTWLDEVHQIIGDLVDPTTSGGDHGRGRTLAVVVMRAGEVVAEGYGSRLATTHTPGGPVDAWSPLISWSVAKSMVHAAVGIAVGDGLVELHTPAPVPAWQGTDKEHITLQHLLEMRSGLRFIEDYVDHTTSHCLDMLFGCGAADHATYAASLPLDHPPGSVWNYSSGTTNIIARVLGDAVGGDRDDMAAWLERRLFQPVGMTTARPEFDAAGTWVGSSYVHASAQDFARFGELYRTDGCVGGTRILPQGWVGHAARLRSIDPASGLGYGAHWWWWPMIPDALVAQGYDGQLVIVDPSRDATVVHLGQWPAVTRDALRTVMCDLVHRLPPVTEPTRD